MTWREQPDGTYISDSSPYIAAPIGGGDYSLSCLDPKEDKRFLRFSEILQAPFFPVPVQFRLDDGRTFALKALSGTILSGASSITVAHGIPNLITGAKYLSHVSGNSLSTSQGALQMDPLTNAINSIAFNDTNLVLARSGTTGNTTGTAILFYLV